jgi:hypothetical protein
VKVHFSTVRKEVRVSEVRKVVKRDPAWIWLLVGNSSYLNGDVWNTCGDSKFRQINPRVNHIVCFLVFLLFELFE